MNKEQYKKLNQIYRQSYDRSHPDFDIMRDSFQLESGYDALNINFMRKFKPNNKGR